MVSKFTRRTPTKSRKFSPSGARRCRQRKPSSSPLKTLAAAAASFDRSLRSCQRCLFKLIPCLAVLHTPIKRKQGFRRLVPVQDDKSQTTGRSTSSSLPLPSATGRKTIVLDLDETLIHSTTGIPPERYDFVVRPWIEGQEMTFYVLKRPGVDELLCSAAEFFEVIIFTAGLKEYASLILDQLDPSRKLIAHRLYRDSCREAQGGKLTKDLSGLGRDLRKVVIVDDNPVCYALQKENAVPVTPFIDDLGDRELRRVMSFLNVAGGFEDMRDAVEFFLAGAKPADEP
ncbi:Mitochondrial import inner membrane translocase subunit TIM50 [Apostasia shenzhenica]|uniref:Mitochondrial import inner membrane translocase subunit TIM50 n=1 Tax=Apostasia shenzhenica TaxID=1088818 RepID=A0A2I0A7Y6_9ASPA|nr:Mitochondrial import inner membrane translocase subunit TIM50 [Apostasia shenzhenica]